MVVSFPLISSFSPTLIPLPENGATLAGGAFFFVQERWRQQEMRECKDDEAKGVQDAIYF